MWKVRFSKTPRGHYRPYSPTSLTSAYFKVKETHAPIRKTAREYGVPEATLRDRLHLRVDPEVTRSGPSPLFSQEEEAHLANHLEFMSSIGYGYSRAEVIEMAMEYATSLGHRDSDHPLSVQWYKNFMARWPALKVLKPRGLHIQRAKTTSEASVQRYFTELGTILNKYHLLDSPERLYNVDEKGLSAVHKAPNVVAAAGTKLPSVSSGGRTNVTVIGCGNALGHQIPPYFVFPGERMRQELLDGCTPGTSGTVTQSGWSNSGVFRSYLQQHLIKHLPERSSQKPVLLLYDGHRSHFSLDLIDWAKKHHIILFVLSADTSHVLQPMDVGCFGPFEKIYNASAHKFMRLQCGISITRTNICEVACKAYAAALSAANLQTSFRKAGIYPFNPNVVDSSNFIPSTALEQETDENCINARQQAGTDGTAHEFFLQGKTSLSERRSHKQRKGETSVRS